MAKINVTVPAPEHKTFESFADILKDEKFDEFLKKELYLIENRPEPPKGQRYKRGPYEVLEEKGLFDLERFVEEFERVAKKTTSLSSAVRRYIVQIVNSAAQKTVIHYQKQPEKA